MEKEKDELFEASLDLFLNEKHPDYTITCLKWTWNLHKSILCPRNPYFQALFSTQTSFPESSTSTVDWPSEQPWATFRYPQHIDALHSKVYDLNGPESNHWRYHWTLFLLADRRQALGLKERALSALLDAMSTDWDFEWFVELMPELWDCQVKDSSIIRRHSIELAMKHKSSLVQEPVFLNMLPEVEDFTKSWVKKLVRENERFKKRQLEQEQAEKGQENKDNERPAKRRGDISTPVDRSQGTQGR
ncbi:MAG: hypothetical protein Q9160_005525 [Pyrenula sp. 1 TL-2023]